ncbi:MAG: hypothetical protein GX242_06235 [Clostridiales bacterium]|nr:hypothetical protein [Clostridiales bacterium]
MEKIKPDIKITRIGCNFSSSPHHSIDYDTIRKCISITTLDKPVKLKDRCITITISLRLKLE